MTERLGAYAVFAGVLSAAGLPIYIHAPKFYVDNYGVTLAASGVALLALRLVDSVQDPLLGRLAERLGDLRGLAVAIAAALMGLGMVALFAVQPMFSPVLWFSLSLLVVFSAFSFLTIVFYATGTAKAAGMAGQGHLRLARWRESGALLGVCLAAMAPFALEQAGVPPFAAYAIGFAGACGVAVWVMRPEWQVAGNVAAMGFGPVLRDPGARWLLLLAFVNAMPVAVSSTLFLYFVESRLDAPGMEGPLLLLFFFAAALSAPVWSLLAERFGGKPVLLSAMVMAIAAFGWAYLLGPGDVWAFAVICLASGAVLGADLTLLPALFARRMARVADDASAGFALWSFVSKFTLAFAAAALLPTLEGSGFQPGSGNSGEALGMLSLLYAGVPCALKLVAIALLIAAPFEEDAC